jgi:alanine or glycine:cation symporter, AGCS family
VFASKWIYKSTTLVGISVFMLGTLAIADSGANSDTGTPANDRSIVVKQPAPRPITAKLEALFESVSGVLRQALFYDFGTRRMPQFGAAPIRSQLAKDYFQGESQAFFSKNVPACLANFSAKQGRFPKDFAELQTVLSACGDELPSPPRGTAYRLDEQGQLLIEPSGTSIPLIVICLLLSGLFLTIRMGFVNVFGIIPGWRYLFRRNVEVQGEVSPLQAFSSNLATTISLSSAGAVALAIGTGGLGSAFWVIAFGFVGMSIKFAECTLGLVYRKETADGKILGGPMRYLSIGFRGREMFGIPLRPLGKILGFTFATMCICASLIGGGTYQVSQSLAAMHQSSSMRVLTDQPLIYGLLMSVLVAMAIFGGVRSIGQINGRLMPLIWLLFVAACVWVIITGRQNLSAAFETIFQEAFDAQSLTTGGFWGILVVAVQGTLANQVGSGSSAIIHSAARTEDPVRHGMVAMLAPLFDTVLLCLLTTLAIAVSGVCSTTDGQALVNEKHGISLVFLAFKSSLPNWTIGLLCGALCVAAFASCLTWSYCGERCFVQLLGDEASIFYKIAFIGFMFLGSVLSVTTVVELGDLLILAMILPNLFGVLMLHKVVREELVAYRSRR